MGSNHPNTHYRNRTHRYMFGYHTLIQCSAFDHIRAFFSHIFDQAQSLHEFPSQPQCALSIATFIGKVLEH